MRSGGTRSALPHIPALDGLRGLAVAAVLLFHAEVAGVTGGFLGVSMFFTLSGFLITALLVIDHRDHGRVRLSRFWARRFRRLMPAALVALAGIALYGLLVADAGQLDTLRADGLSALGYVANWRFVLNGQSYAALFSDPSPVQHFWSLAIEEQCYLVLPLVVVGVFTLTRGRRAHLVLGALIAALIAAGTTTMWLLYEPGRDPARVYYGTDTRAAELLVGALLALVVVPHLAPTRRAARVRLPHPAVGRALAVAGGIALCTLALSWFTVRQSDGWLHRGGLLVHALLVALVILAALEPGPVRAALSWRPLVALGVVSYGVYLFHWPIFLWLSPERTGVDGAGLFVLRVLVTLGLAVASYHLIEAPIRRGERVTAWRPFLVAPAGAAAVALALVAVSLSGAPEERIVFAAAQRGAPAMAASPGGPAEGARVGARGGAGDGVDTALPVTGAPSATPATPATPVAPVPTAPARTAPATRVMVVGDSVAQTLGRGLERWGARRGVDVWNVATFWCGIPRGGVRNIGAEVGPSTCEQWTERWANQVGRFRPEVVVVLSTIWDIAPRKRAEWGNRFRELGDELFDAYTVEEYRAAVDVLTARGARVVWLTTPCASDARLSAQLEQLSLVYLPQLVASRPDRVRVVDITTALCPDGQFTPAPGGVDGARPDGLHFSDRGADWVAEWLGPEVVRPT